MASNPTDPNPGKARWLKDYWGIIAAAIAVIAYLIVKVACLECDPEAIAGLLVLAFLSAWAIWQMLRARRAFKIVLTALLLAVTGVLALFVVPPPWPSIEIDVLHTLAGDENAYEVTDQLNDAVYAGGQISTTLEIQLRRTSPRTRVLGKTVARLSGGGRPADDRDLPDDFPDKQETTSIYLTLDDLWQFSGLQTQAHPPANVLGAGEPWYPQARLKIEILAKSRPERPLASQEILVRNAPWLQQSALVWREGQLQADVYLENLGGPGEFKFYYKLARLDGAVTADSNPISSGTTVVDEGSAPGQWVRLGPGEAYTDTWTLAPQSEPGRYLLELYAIKKQNYLWFPRQEDSWDKLPAPWTFGPAPMRQIYLQPAPAIVAVTAPGPPTPTPTGTPTATPTATGTPPPTNTPTATPTATGTPTPTNTPTPPPTPPVTPGTPVVSVPGALATRFPAPGITPVALAAAGDRLWVADDKQRVIYQLDRAGEPQVSLPITPTGTITGLVWDGEALHLSLSGTAERRQIVRLDASGGVQRALSLPIAPDGLAWDARHGTLWVYSRGSFLLEFNQEGRLLQTVHLPTQGSIDGLAWAEDGFWVIDAFDKWYRFSDSGVLWLRGDLELDPPVYVGALSLDGTGHLWLLTTRDRQILQFALRSETVEVEPASWPGGDRPLPRPRLEPVADTEQAVVEVNNYLENSITFTVGDQAPVVAKGTTWTATVQPGDYPIRAVAGGARPIAFSGRELLVKGYKHIWSIEYPTEQ